MDCHKLDINAATAEDLESWLGLNEQSAMLVVTLRESLGGFASLDDLCDVPEIGADLLAQNRQSLCCGIRGCSDRTMVAAVESAKSNVLVTARTLSDSAVVVVVPPSREPEDRGCCGVGSSSCGEESDEEEKPPVCDGRVASVKGKAAAEDCLQVQRRRNSTGEVNARDNEIDVDMTDSFPAVKRKSDETLDARSPPGTKRLCCPAGVHPPTASPGSLHSVDEGSALHGASFAAHQPHHYGHIPLASHQSISETCSASFSPPPRTRRASCRMRPPPAELESWLKMFQSWDNVEKLLALDDLIDICDASHVRHMMSVIEPQFQRDFISLLPKELALYVLSFLDARDLVRAAQTCRAWRSLAEDGLLWREKCREEAIDETAAALARASCQQGGGSAASAAAAAAVLPWKSFYLRQHRIEHNWRKGELRPPKVLRGHDDHVITCLEFCGNRIVSGSDDNTLKVWSVDTGRCLRNLVGHTGGVWSSQMKDKIVVSGSTDRTLKVWNTETGECVHTLHGHTSTVRCLHLHGDTVVSGSRDATLRMWDIRNGECMHVLTGHVAAVRCVQYDGVKVVSGAYDYSVRVWDPATESCIHVLQGHTNRVYSLQFDGTHIVSGSLDTSIRVWDAETGACRHTLVGHQSLTSGMELKDNILVSGNADSTVKVWDIVTGQCLQTLQGPHKHQSAVTCLQFNRKFVITSSDDGTVKLWSLKTGDFLRNLVTLESGGSGGVVWRVKADSSKLVCAAGSRNGTEETKLLVLDFDLVAPSPLPTRDD